MAFRGVSWASRYPFDPLDRPDSTFHRLEHYRYNPYNLAHASAHDMAYDPYLGMLGSGYSMGMGIYPGMGMMVSDRRRRQFGSGSTT